MTVTAYRTTVTAGEQIELRSQERIRADLAKLRAETTQLRLELERLEQTRRALAQDVVDARIDAVQMTKRARADAAAILAKAERAATTIRETAFQQGRVICEGAHRDGYHAGREYAIARNAALRHHAPGKG